jgi:hypothetical protein
MGLSRYLLAGSFCLVSCGACLGAVGLGLALESWSAFTARTRIAELQCIELDPGSLRVFFVPVERDGTRGKTEVYDVEGDQWAVWGDVLRLRPTLNALGLSTLYKVSRIEGRWTKAADATRHLGSARDRAQGTTPTWLTLYREGTRGPLGWLVDGVHGQAVSQLPDRRAVYDLYVTPNGFIVDKRSL